MPKQQYWIGEAIERPGALRKFLGIKRGDKVPEEELAAAAKKPGKLGQRARIAQTLDTMRQKRGA